MNRICFFSYSHMCIYVCIYLYEGFHGRAYFKFVIDLSILRTLKKFNLRRDEEIDLILEVNYYNIIYSTRLKV